MSKVNTARITLSLLEAERPQFLRGKDTPKLRKILARHHLEHGYPELHAALLEAEQ